MSDAYYFVNRVQHQSGERYEVVQRVPGDGRRPAAETVISNHRNGDVAREKSHRLNMGGRK